MVREGCRKCTSCFEGGCLFGVVPTYALKVDVLGVRGVTGDLDAISAQLIGCLCGVRSRKCGKRREAGRQERRRIMSDPSDDERTATFLRLYAESELVLRAYVRSLVPTREMASEVIQDVLLVLWRKFESAENFKAWSFGVARKIVARHMRSRARDRHVFDDELAEKLADDALRLAAEHNHQREAFEHCLEGLRSEHRDLLLLAYSKGVKMEELARQRGQSPMSLYKWLHRVRMALFECVQRRVRREGMA